MTHDKTLSTRARKSEPEGGPEEPAAGVSPLLAQAKGFAQVARDAVNDCHRGEDALRELRRRRNRSGQ